MNPTATTGAQEAVAAGAGVEAPLAEAAPAAEVASPEAAPYLSDTFRAALQEAQRGVRVTSVLDEEAPPALLDTDPVDSDAEDEEAVTTGLEAELGSTSDGGE